MKEEHVGIKCIECRNALRIRESELPDGLRSDEVFERECPFCEETTYMALVKETQVSK